MSDGQLELEDFMKESEYVTRCMDCINFTESDEWPPYDGTCSAWNWQLTKTDWYCSRAERRKT